MNDHATPVPADSVRPAVSDLEEFIESRIIGQEGLVEALLIALLADGHLLVEGAPGLAKTRAVRVLADGIDASFHRIQFTPDLLPADLTGTEIYRPQDGSFRFQQGPLFHNLVLADEINRAPAKVQSALLEAMAERQITVGLQTYHLPALFLVMATQNPLEQEGTYPLPEAQLDRFMLNVVIGYPTAEDERAILAQTTTGDEPVASPVATGEAIERARLLVREVVAAENVIGYAARLVRATRPVLESEAPDFVRQWVRWGAGPRAGQALLLAGKARAVIHGRPAVSLEDVRAVAPPVLRHRVLVNFQAEADGIDAEAVVGRLLDTVHAR